MYYQMQYPCQKWSQWHIEVIHFIKSVWELYVQRFIVSYLSRMPIFSVLLALAEELYVTQCEL